MVFLVLLLYGIAKSALLNSDEALMSEMLHLNWNAPNVPTPQRSTTPLRAEMGEEFHPLRTTGTVQSDST